MVDALAGNDPGNKGRNTFDEHFFMSGRPDTENTMDRRTTMSTLITHNKHALREIQAGGQYPDSYGMTDYATSVLVGDIMRRSRIGNIPWEIVMNDAFSKVHLVAHQLTNTTCGQSYLPEEDEGGE